MFVLLIAAICSGNAAQAQAKTGAKSEITGHWAAPDCARTDEAVSFTRHFYLKSRADGMALYRYRQTGTGADHLILEMDDRTYAVQRQEDGVLRLGAMTENRPASKAAWDDRHLSTQQDYANCPATPSVIAQPLQRLLRHVDRIDAACSLSPAQSRDVPRRLAQDCARALFKAADENDDNHLTPLEIRRAALSAHLLSSLARGQPLDAQAIDDAGQAAKDMADRLADAMLTHQDRNGDGRLDYNETVEGFAAGDTPGLKEMLKDIGALMPVFRLAASGL